MDYSVPLRVLLWINGLSSAFQPHLWIFIVFQIQDMFKLMQSSSTRPENDSALFPGSDRPTICHPRDSSTQQDRRRVLKYAKIGERQRSKRRVFPNPFPRGWNMSGSLRAAPDRRLKRDSFGTMMPKPSRRSAPAPSDCGVAQLNPCQLSNLRAF
jgi:hypothetical protein